LLELSSKVNESKPLLDVLEEIDAAQLKKLLGDLPAW